MRQQLLADDISRRATAACAGYTGRLDRLDERALRWRPSGGGWSLSQLAEHLLLTWERYQARMRPAMAAAPPDRAGHEWKPTLAGRLLLASLHGGFRLPAPRVFRPGPAPRDDAREALLAHFGQLRALLDEAGGCNWRRTIFRSPASSLIRLNIGDGFATLVTHAERHLKQADRIIASAGFPG